MKNSIITRLIRKHECISHVSNVAGFPANLGGKGDQKLAFHRILIIIIGPRASEETDRGRCGEERSSVIPVTLHDGKSQRKSK